MTLFTSGTQNVFNSVNIGANKTMSAAQKTAEVQSPPGDTVSCLRFSPESMQTTFLAATSWDNRIRIWEVQANGSTIPKAEQMHQGPVFGACWSTDGSKLFSVSADKTAQMWDLGSNTFTQVGVHDAPVKTAHFITAPNYSCLMTGSWDKRLRFWDTRQSQPILNLDLPERIYCADVHYPLALVGTAGRQIFVYNLENGPTQFSQLESPLKFQSRCISIFMDKQKQNPSGFALGSIEGRVAIQYLNPTTPKDNFTFKCHRSNAPVNGYHEIFAVNDMAFHPVHGTLATVGSDGCYSFWDKDARTKLHSSDSPDQPLTCCVFDPKGQVFCYASGYDWSKGYQFADPSKPIKIMMRLCMEDMTPGRKS
ncbi:mRNA export protein rae1-related [Schistosoma mansoni]|uniref:mRNA export protein rae1-related n=1 Tax=Schistosoma mansoni TaxID=6183 RepID=G4VQN0_SCHMA|nr:mRNA export protein rae1-related [Schistosoma mansoni]|eukprot:XP_018655175.1 mRNA export protein rae1-related [Schistosoma mansoni]